MDIKDLNKSQLILLAILLSFVTSIATGITTVTLLQQAPSSVTVPITRIVQETVDQVAPTAAQPAVPALSDDEKNLLAELKAIKPLTVTLYQKGDTDADDKVLGTGLFLGDDRVVFASLIPAPTDGQIYVVKSVLGEQSVSQVTDENDFTIVQLVDTDDTATTAPDTGINTDSGTTPPATGTNTSSDGNTTTAPQTQ